MVALSEIPINRHMDPSSARSCAMMSQMRLTSSDISANAPITKTSTRPPLYHPFGRDKGISWCRKADGGVKAEVAQVLGDMFAKKATESKRKIDFAAATSSIVGSAAALAAAKRSRPSSSSGQDVGAAGIASAFATPPRTPRKTRGAPTSTTRRLM